MRGRMGKRETGSSGLGTWAQSVVRWGAGVLPRADGGGQVPGCWTLREGAAWQPSAGPIAIEASVGSSMLIQAWLMGGGRNGVPLHQGPRASLGTGFARRGGDGAKGQREGDAPPSRAGQEGRRLYRSVPPDWVHQPEGAPRTALPAHVVPYCLTVLHPVLQDPGPMQAEAERALVQLLGPGRLPSGVQGSRDRGWDLTATGSPCPLGFTSRSSNCQAALLQLKVPRVGRQRRRPRLAPPLQLSADGRLP
jgi:hypothetical protein